MKRDNYGSYGRKVMARDDWDDYSEIVAVTAAHAEPMENPDDPQAWKELAVCAQTDPEIFFPDKGGSTREAKAICQRCEVRDSCLEYALAGEERFGIWGGLSERERRRLKRGIA